MTNAATSNNLSKRIFAEGIGMIADRWNREIPPSTSAVMAEWLSSRGCTADEFITGVKRAIAEDEWPPSAKRILDLARPEAAPDARAAEMFDRVLAIRAYVPGHGLRLKLDEVLAQLGEVAHRATVAVGVPRLTSLTDDARPFVQKEFVHAFTEFDRESASRHTTVVLLERATARRQLGSGADSPIHPKSES